MLINILWYIFLSFFIIFILHNLFKFFKDNLTTPKVKDLVNKPESEYKKIYETINKQENNNENEKMKDELKNYMKNLTLDNNLKIRESKEEEKDNIQSFNSISGFSEF